jgi:hypothetical protein
MSFWRRLLPRGPDLDETVAGHQGEAHARYEGLREGQELFARAALAPGLRGRLRLAVMPSPASAPEGSPPAAAEAAPRSPREAQGTDRIEAALGPAEELGGARLFVEAEIHGPRGPELAGLSVTLFQRAAGAEEIAEMDAQSFSVESRLDAAGQARLRLTVTLG